MNEDAIIQLVFIVLAFGIVLPIWLALHYQAKRRPQAETATPADAPQVERLLITAERLQKRVAALEAILDAEHPGWRDAHER